MAHRDLKFKNFLIEINSLFKIVIVDFDLIKIAIDIALLKTFYDSLKYAASKMFFDLSFGHKILIDV